MSTLAILDLLGIDGGVVVLTKMDLIDDPDWLELVMLDVGEALAGSVLENAPIVPVSAFSGEGLDDLKEVLQERLSETEARPDFGRPRLSVDRAFTLPGFGNIVTGTLVDGRFRIGDQVEIQPGDRKGRIRGLQTHQQKLEVAKPGSRVAINLSGIDRKEVGRGDVVAAPGTVEDTILFDATYRQLSDAASPLKHNMQVKLFVGAAEVIARTRVLGTRQIDPGQEGWLQLALQEPVALVRGDRFILRRPSPAATLGGGHVLDAHPGRSHRRFRSDVTDRLQTLTHGTPSELLAQTMARIEPTTQQNLFQQSGLDPDTAKAALGKLESDQQIIWLGKQIISRAGWQQLIDKLANILSHYHRDHPLRWGFRAKNYVAGSAWLPLSSIPCSQKRPNKAYLLSKDRLYGHPNMKSPFPPLNRHPSIVLSSNLPSRARIPLRLKIAKPLLAKVFTMPWLILGIFGS